MLDDHVHVVDRYDMPTEVDRDVVYHLMPKDPSHAYYAERVDRNIGWITDEEQSLLYRSRIGIAGCGGMGGRLAEIFLRLGVGELCIADSEPFDVSNINRQLAATRSTVGKSKATETAHHLRAITDDTTLVVYPRGIEPNMVARFVRGCTAICDEIEFWCVGARILLHRTAREHGVPVFVANTVGFGSHAFLFTPGSMTMEECLGFTYEEAVEVEHRIAHRVATRCEIARVMNAVTRGLFPEWREYCGRQTPLKNRVFIERRLIQEQKGPIIATNPPFACGFLADRMVLYLLRNSPIERAIVPFPEMPGYLYLDAATLEAKRVAEKWW